MGFRNSTHSDSQLLLPNQANPAGNKYVFFPSRGNIFMQYLSTTKTNQKMNINFTIPLTFGCIAYIQSLVISQTLFVLYCEKGNP